MEDSPFIPPMPSPYGAQRGVIPSPASDDRTASPAEEQPYNMRRMPRQYPYAGFPGPMHTPAYVTPGGQWTPWGGFPVFGPLPPGHGPHSHSAPYMPGPLPPGPTPYHPYHPMSGTPYPHPHAYPGSYMAGSSPMAPAPGLYADDMPYMFPERPSDDIMNIDQWAVGSHYAPVLTPFQVAILDATLVVNPLLTPAGENPPPDRAYLRYNVLFPTGTARRSIDPPSRSWSIGRLSPATSPRVSKLRLISRNFPWVLEIEASRPAHGVTCLDVIDGIHEQLQAIIPRQQVTALSGVKGENYRRRLYEVYHYNRSTARDAPGGSMGEGIRRADWLLNNVMFDGLVNDQKFVQETLGIAGPGWKSMKKKEGDAAAAKDKPQDKLQGWPATLVLKLDQRYGESEADGESIITDDTEHTETTEQSEHAEGS